MINSVQVSLTATHDTQNSNPETFNFVVYNAESIRMFIGDRALDFQTEDLAAIVSIANSLHN